MSSKKSKSPVQLNLLDCVRYDARFLENHTGGRILRDPKIAIVELIANAWDAGATEVKISWNENNNDVLIEDNGIGMTDEEFTFRWPTLSYNRKDKQGLKVVFPADHIVPKAERRAFGQNGIGRWSGFCFGQSYFVETRKAGHKNKYKVSLAEDKPFKIERLVVDAEENEHGTIIECPHCHRTLPSPEDLRAEIGMRFLTDPNFRVLVNGQAVDFSDIDDPNIKKIKLCVKNNSLELIVIDTLHSDRTMKQHGVAWHVGGRLVGGCTWRGLGQEDLVDGRRNAAKRFTFIVRADFLADTEAIKKDWSDFDKDNEDYQGAARLVYEKVREYLLKVSEEDRKETLQKARENSIDILSQAGPMALQNWTNFVEKAQTECPSIKQNDILKLSTIVANLQNASSGYALLHRLSELDPDQLDDLNKILQDWTLDMAKAVLDEIGLRLKLIEEMRARVFNKNTKEVQELQPLFEKGLWIFGPEFETIEYTSNEGMTRVIQEFFKDENAHGSLNRPDFVVRTSGTVGLYSYPQYDEQGEEIGTSSLVIIELKKPGVEIGTDEKSQCWKYVSELYRKGYLQDISRVKCFVLGSRIDPIEVEPRTEKSEKVSIQPMLFATVLERAKSRLLKLSERVKDAPFLKDHREELESFVASTDKKERVIQSSLL